MIYLFSVEDRFSIKGLGIVLAPGIPDAKNLSNIRKGSRIQLRKPDLTTIDTFIKDLEMIRRSPDVHREDCGTGVLPPQGFHKFDIPLGTEVHLMEDPDKS